MANEGIARAVLKSVENDTVVLAVPGTDYQLHLVSSVPTAKLKGSIGSRVAGTIEGRALRMHPAEGGGQFIEPVYGSPRIVAGTVVDVDDDAGRVLVNVGVPMWVTWQEGQDRTVLEPGRLVNFYVESGTTFTILSAP